MADPDQDVDPHLLRQLQDFGERRVVDGAHERDADPEGGRRERHVLGRRARVEQREDVTSLTPHRGLRALQVGADDDDRDGVGKEARGHVAHGLHQPRVGDHDQPTHELVAAHRRQRRRVDELREELLRDRLGGEAPVHAPAAHRLEDVHQASASSSIGVNS